MSRTSTLEGPELAPLQGDTPHELVVLLHGVGADGDDLIALAEEFQEVLPGAHFIAPHAPFPFDMAPMGRQWFSLADADEDALLAGVRRSAPMVEAFIDEQLDRFGLSGDRLALVGFSQGTMMALHVGLRLPETPAGILGYSGMLVGADALRPEIRAWPPVTLVHGEADEVVAFPALEAATHSLRDAGVAVESHAIPFLGHGLDEEAIRLGRDFLAQIMGGPGS